MADNAREASMAVIIEKYFPKDYGDPRHVASVVIDAMFEQGLDVTQRSGTIDTIREQGYQQGQKDARRHFVDLAADGLEAHQWSNPDADSNIPHCSCGWDPKLTNDKKGKSPGTPWDQWRAHAAFEMSGLALR